MHLSDLVEYVVLLDTHIQVLLRQFSHLTLIHLATCCFGEVVAVILQFLSHLLVKQEGVVIIAIVVVFETHHTSHEWRVFYDLLLSFSRNLVMKYQGFLAFSIGGFFPWSPLSSP